MLLYVDAFGRWLELLGEAVVGTGLGMKGG